MSERRSVWILSLAIVAMTMETASAAVMTDDFSTASPYWQYVNYPANATVGIAGEKMVVDFLEIPGYGIAPGIAGAIYGNPGFMPETTEMTSVLEIDGDSSYLYAGLLARGSADLGYDGTNITGNAYILTISGYGGDGDLQINRIGGGEQTRLAIMDFTDYGDLIDSNPLYMKLTVETLVGGDVEIKGKISIYSDFTSPFGEIEAIDSDPALKISGAGFIGLIGMNDEDEPCQPVKVYFDDLYVADFIDTTLLGDCNGDGFVNSGDLDIVRGNWGQSVGGGASDGDLSGDGLVNSADLDVVRGNWGAMASASVPEPGTLLLLSLVAQVILWKRR